MSHPVSPLAPAAQPSLPAVAGVRLATGAAGIRYRDRTDVLLVEMAAVTTVAGVYTKSLTRSAPVDWCRKAMAGGKARALVVPRRVEPTEAHERPVALPLPRHRNLRRLIVDKGA